VCRPELPRAGALGRRRAWVGEGDRPIVSSPKPGIIIIIMPLASCPPFSLSATCLASTRTSWPRLGCARHGRLVYDCVLVLWCDARGSDQAGRLCSSRSGEADEARRGPAQDADFLLLHVACDTYRGGV
jgi:hypothetical protein